MIGWATTATINEKRVSKVLKPCQRCGGGLGGEGDLCGSGVGGE
jgi:hypothetical protein